MALDIRMKVKRRQQPEQGSTRLSAHPNLSHVPRKELGRNVLSTTAEEGTNDYPRARLPGFVHQSRDVDGLGHGPVAGVIGMQVVAAVVVGPQMIRLLGIAHHLGEVDHHVEHA